MKEMQLEDQVATPKYLQLYDQLQWQIRQGELKPGDRLPSFSELRALYGAMPATVERTYARLQRENLIERQPRRGVFVAQPKTTLTGNIGFIGDPLTNKRQSPFNTNIEEGVRQAAELEQQHLLYMCCDDSQNLNTWEKIDGVLICNTDNISLVTSKLPVLLPRVSVLIVADGMTSVVADDFRGARMAVHHLIELGHRRIACLMERQPSIARQRFAGYMEALQEAGIKPDPRWSRLTSKERNKTVRQPYLEWGKAHMQKWLQEDWDELGCTAILVQNEVAAVGVMQVLQKEGISIPEQVSVMGFDGTEICDLSSPTLCAAAIPLAQIGAKAMEMLNQQIAGEPDSELVIMLPMSLHEGESVAPPSF